MDGGGDKSALASELAQVLAMVRELEARMDQDPLPAAARELCAGLASSVDRSIRIARKGTPCVRRQLRAASLQDAAALDDGLSWRKYGQKDILGAKYPRAYFRCTHRHSQGCLATKHVQRADGDPLLHDVVYHGAHTCVQAAHPGANQLRQELQLQHGHSAQDKDQGASSPLALATGLLEPMTPYSFASGADFPLFSPTGLDGQLRSSHGAGIGVEFETLFEELFTNATEPFQWDLYAAN
ncbi:putative WRKY transcription factor 53 [Zea mays]|uniref:Putative WRKY transcription factor 53 n=1 Tax=Zea mays TaxID=4577 RepID=A0A3L6DU44_MAIZE|nr:putative WRKY transcription factor 53 [Zea mays]